jgi:Tol biopolymer transport system component
MRRASIIAGAVVVLGASATAAILIATRTGITAPSRAPSSSLVYSESAGRNPMNTTVWRANVDGTHRVPLTKGSDPTISPDGQHVTFVRETCTSTPPVWTCGDSKLFVAPTRGGKVERIANAMSAPPTLAWAPDSRRLAVEAKGGIYVFDPKTGKKTPIASGRFVGSPSFSPNSRLVVYERDKLSSTPHSGSSYASDLYVADLASGKSRRITRLGDATGPVWGPSEIAFRHNYEIWLTDPTGNRLRRLAGKKTTGYGWPAVWSANGRVLLVSLFEFRGKGKFRAIDVPSGRVSFAGSGSPLGLSRDGRVALVDDCAYGPGTAFGRVETVPLNGGKVRSVVPQNGICWASWTG